MVPRKTLATTHYSLISLYPFKLPSILFLIPFQLPSFITYIINPFKLPSFPSIINYPLMMMIIGVEPQRSYIAYTIGDT